MSKHCLCYHGQGRQNSSCFGSSSLFILTRANVHTLALQGSVSWLVAMGVWKANFFQLREGCSCSLLLSLCPALAESLQSWKRQHQPHHRVKRAAPSTKCCKTFLGLFLQMQHSGKHWSCFSLCDKGPQALSFRGCPANPTVLVICHCCWNQSEPCLLPGNLQAMEKKNPSSLGTFSPQQTTAFPLSALHPLCQIYRSCIREMGMMGLL